jgi:Bacterial alpha-L-rhamnosidase C-terminal domain
LTSSASAPKTCCQFAPGRFAKFTGLGEQWPASTRSRNHHFFGAIVQWFHEGLAGIQALEPGYHKIEFKPEIPTTGLESVSASYESICGRVAIRWNRVATGLEVDVTVPPNATELVYVPASNPQAATEAGKGKAVIADRAESVKLIGVRAASSIRSVLVGINFALPIKAGRANSERNKDDGQLLLDRVLRNYRLGNAVTCKEQVFSRSKD